MKPTKFLAAATVIPLSILAFAAPASAKATVRCVVPNVKGNTLAKAEKAIKKAHCKVGKVHLTGGSVDRVVISQSPKARRRERNGYKVSITLRGKQKVTTTTGTTPPPPVTPSLTATSTTIATVIGTVGSGEDYFLIGVDAETLAGGAEITTGTPLTYTVTDISTGAAMGSFVEPQDTACTLIETAEGNEEFSLAGYTCPSSFSITVNGSDEYRITATFPGDGTYASSTSLQAVV
jgi:hypothetical protein